MILELRIYYSQLAFLESYGKIVSNIEWKRVMVNPLKHVYLEVAVNGCCIAPVNVIKFKINYSSFF